jgi:hypothetical protein
LAQCRDWLARITLPTDPSPTHAQSTQAGETKGERTEKQHHAAAAVRNAATASEEAADGRTMATTKSKGQTLTDNNRPIAIPSTERRRNTDLNI